MEIRPRCRRCRTEIPNLVSTGVDANLCSDCQQSAPRTDGLIDFTKLRGRLIRPKQFVDEKTGKVIEDNPPLNTKGFWHKPEPNELWAQKGIENGKRKNHK